MRLSHHNVITAIYSQVKLTSHKRGIHRLLLQHHGNLLCNDGSETGQIEI